MQEEPHPPSFDAGPPPTVRLYGEVDFRMADALRQALRRAETHTGDLHIDLKTVTYIDSSGYAELMEAANRLSPGGRRVVLLAPSRTILHVLNTAGLGRYFDLRPTPGPPKGESSVSPGFKGYQRAAFTIPCQVNLLSLARERVMSIARELPFTEEELSEIELAAGEALSNALRHGCSDPRNRISVECEANRARLILHVSDSGGGFLPDSIPLPDLDSLQEGGMGLHFMRIMMDEVTYTFDENGTTVCITKEPKAVKGGGDERNL